MVVKPRIRVVVAKPGLDGHDRGPKIIARAIGELTVVAREQCGGRPER